MRDNWGWVDGKSKIVRLCASKAYEYTSVKEWFYWSWRCKVGLREVKSLQQVTMWVLGNMERHEVLGVVEPFSGHM